MVHVNQPNAISAGVVESVSHALWQSSVIPAEVAVGASLMLTATPRHAQRLAHTRYLSAKRCAADASDESDSEQKCERPHGRRAAAPKRLGQAGRKGPEDARPGTTLREGPRADAGAGRGLRAGRRAACSGKIGELSPPLFKNAQRGCRSRPGAPDCARGAGGGAGGSRRMSQVGSSPCVAAAAAAGESAAQRSALQLQAACLSDRAAAAGRPLVLWGRAASPSPERELLLQQEDFLFSPRRPGSNAKVLPPARSRPQRRPSSPIEQVQVNLLSGF